MAIAGESISCTVQPLDVADLEQWQSLKAFVDQDYGGAIDGLINNAGITFAGALDDTSYDRFESVMSVNFMGAVYGTKEFLPLLEARDEAALVNVSSVFGLMPMKSQSAYCASKYALRGFTEVVAQELKDSKVLVCCVFPGHIGTNIISNAHKSGNVVAQGVSEEYLGAYANEFRRSGLPPSEAATTILDGLQRKSRSIAVGDDARRAVALGRLFPVWYADRVNKDVA